MKLLATKAVANDIPMFILTFMFRKVCELDNRDYLQVFNIDSKYEELSIIHTQEEPEFEARYVLVANHDINGKLFAVIEDDYCTFMYADEY